MRKQITRKIQKLHGMLSCNNKRYKENNAGKGDEGACHKICYNKCNCHNRAARGSVELRVTKDFHIWKL